MTKTHEELEEKFNWCCLLCEKHIPIYSTEEQKVIPNCSKYGILYCNNLFEEDELRERIFKKCYEGNNYSKKAA